MIEQFNDHAANERTFLAWVRTSMALVGFGLAIAHLRGKDPGILWQATLVGIGGLVVMVAFIRMHVLMRRIEEPGSYSYTTGVHSVLFAGSLASLLTLVAIFVWHIV